MVVPQRTVSEDNPRTGSPRYTDKGYCLCCWRATGNSLNSAGLFWAWARSPGSPGMDPLASHPQVAWTRTGTYTLSLVHWPGFRSPRSCRMVSRSTRLELTRNSRPQAMAATSRQRQTERPSSQHLCCLLRAGTPATGGGEQPRAPRQGQNRLSVSRPPSSLSHPAATPLPWPTQASMQTCAQVPEQARTWEENHVLVTIPARAKTNWFSSESSSLVSPSRDLTKLSMVCPVMLKNFRAFPCRFRGQCPMEPRTIWQAAQAPQAHRVPAPLPGEMLVPTTQ